MRLFIAEKPSVGRAIASELPHPSNKEGYIECGGGDVVTWAFGHLLEMGMPQDYDPKYEKWRAEDLPILPLAWKLLPKQGAKAQLAVIGKLLEKADTVVNAGDPDREGQLLIDELLHYFGYKKPVERFWVSAQDSVSIRRGLAALKPNRDYIGFAAAAMARSRADWLIGINLSRAYTLRAQRGGSQRTVLSVGRVQTPTLALVVARDRAIEAFKPSPYLILTGTFLHGNGGFRARWKAPVGSPGLDKDGRLISEAVASAVASAVRGKTGAITSYSQEPKAEGHPKAWSLTSLTAAASARFGYAADDVLQAAQKLYEEKLASYPRTDCEFLPESQHSDAPAVLAAVAGNRPDLAGIIAQADPRRKSKTWNDGKVTAHHGIIPTQHKGGDLGRLKPIERDLYDLIVRAYIAQFLPPHEYLATKVGVTVSSHLFEATGKVITAPGWKAALADHEPEDPSDEREPPQVLPPMKQGDRADCSDVETKNCKTKPPPRFTEGSLLKAMENIHKHFELEDPEYKQLLKDGDGIGTPATRAAIISELKRKKFLIPKGKAITSTPLGRELVDSLPEQVKSPALTAVYERQLRAIQARQATVQAFLEGQAAFVRDQVAAANNGALSLTSSAGPECPTCKKGRLRRIKGNNGFFWGCSEYHQGCKATFEDNRGKPALGPKKAIPCPVCQKGELRLRKGQHGNFFGCSTYPECRGAFPEEKGKPVFRQKT